MGLTTLIIASFLTSYVVSDSCVTYNFEENLSDIVGGYGMCSGIPAWVLDAYSNLNLDSPDERSTKFITPTRDGNTKCWSSSVFTISSGGTLEVKLYINSDTMTYVDVFVIDDHTTYIRGYGYVNSQIVKGWHTLALTLYPSSTRKAYISIFGQASASATVLVDSLRYIPPGMNETLCQIYEDLATTPEPTTTSQPTTSPKPITTPELTTTSEPAITSEPTTIPEATMTPEATTISKPTTTPKSTTYPEPTTTPKSTTYPEPTTTPKRTTTLEPITTLEPTTPRPTTTIEPIVTSPGSTTTSPDVRPPTDVEDNTSFWNKIIITINNTININNIK